MMLKRTISIALLTIISLYLAACGGTSAVVSSSTAPKTPFGISLEQSPNSEGWSEQYTGVRLDVVVPLFDPNIPSDPDDYEKEGIWPELRRTEAIRFAVSLSDEIKATNAFNSVRVTPDVAVSGDLFVSGKILESNGEDIRIEVQVHDISGKRWMKRTYKHRVKEYHWQSSRTSATDPYNPVFKKAAADILKLLKKKSSEDLAEIRATSQLQFAATLSPDAFAQHLEVKNNRLKLVSLPAVNDPLLVRTNGMRVQDAIFMDDMQKHYTGFVHTTNASYINWQQHSMESAKAQREAEGRANAQAIGGFLLLLGAAAIADNNRDDTGAALAATAAAVGGISMLQNSFAANSESKYHHDILVEHGESFNREVEPKVILVEGQKFEIRGSVVTQYQKWRETLKLLHEHESPPPVQL